ncbi:S41 family peptidase [Boseaceae bacterium BT-24-1]|nr:S41 family peptidase [Boseaceae bacterium BT-24-1]
MLVLVAAPLAFILYPTLKPYPKASFPAAVAQRDRNLQDLAHLRVLPEVERSFTAESQAAFAQAVAAIETRASDLDRAGLAMAAAKAVALADNGHTNVLGLAGDYGFNAVPIRLGWLADGLFVIAADEDRRPLLGGRVLGVNGRATAALVEALRPYVGGPANLAREFVPNFLISPELLNAAGLAKTANGSTFEIRLADGSAASVDLAAEAARQPPLSSQTWPKRNLSPRVEARPVGWRHVLDGAALPAYLSRPDANYWHDFPAADLLYAQINRVGDQAPVGTSQYLSSLLDEAAKKPIRNAIVDLRFNRGGDYTLTADFTRRLPQILPPNGKLFILTSANTFSAAISTAARLKHFAGERAILVGEAMGDRSQFWGEGGLTLLPNAKIAVRYTTAFHDWERGCGLSQITTCFLLNYAYGVPAGSLQPAITIAPSFADYAAGKDPVMAEVMRQLAPGQGR